MIQQICRGSTGNQKKTAGLYVAAATRTIGVGLIARPRSHVRLLHQASCPPSPRPPDECLVGHRCAAVSASVVSQAPQSSLVALYCVVCRLFSFGRDTASRGRCGHGASLARAGTSGVTTTPDRVASNHAHWHAPLAVAFRSLVLAPCYSKYPLFAVGYIRSVC